MDSDEIPELQRPEEMPPVRTDADLRQRWRALMGELGFAGHSLWMNLVDRGGRMTPMLMQVEALDEHPEVRMLDNLMGICAELVADVEPGGRPAFLLTRPGSAALNEWDRRWARGLVESAGRCGLPLWPVHRANDEVLLVVAPDDLAPAGDWPRSA